MKKKIFLILILTAVISGIFIICLKNPDNPNPEKITLTQQQLEPYLNIKGWSVTFINSETIKLPHNLSGSFKKYADEMKNSGFDLYSHTGESVKRYTYSVDNYGESGVIAELILTQYNELISAALIQQKPDGFIKTI